MQRLLVTAEHAAAKTRAGQPLSFVERAAWTVADRFVFSKVRARFGGKLRFAFSGGAAMAIEVAEFVDSLGVMVYQGYGLTETAAISTVNYPGHRKMGSAGLPLPGMRVEIEPHEEAEEHDGHSVGEIVIHGPSVMVGYHKLPAETAAAFTPGGGLRTGDLGYLDRDGYLFITGRLKEQYKLDNGKFVAPAALEEKLKLSPYVANVMVYGVNRPCNVALVVPDEPAVKGWAVKEGVHLDEARLHRDPKVCALVAGEIARLSAGFGGYEVVRAFEVLEHDLTVESGLLTPSLKVKRAKVVEAYRDRIDAMYERMPSFCPPPGRKEPS
jgi:long-chain acyl-CoA synthetase